MIKSIIFFICMMFMFLVVASVTDTYIGAYEAGLLVLASLVMTLRFYCLYKGEVK